MSDHHDDSATAARRRRAPGARRRHPGRVRGPAHAAPDPRRVARRPPGGPRLSRALHPGGQPGHPRGRGHARRRAARWRSTWATRRSSGTGARCSPPAAQARGIAGLVIDGGVRDTGALEAHGFPVFSTTVALRGASKNRPGTVGAPSTWAGCRWRPGTGSWATPTAWPWCAAAAHRRRARAGRARADKEEAHVHAPCARGRPPSSCSASTRRPVREALTPQAVTRFGGRRPASTSHTPWHGHPGHLGPGGAAGAADVGEQDRAGRARAGGGGPAARPRRRRGPPRRSSRRAARRPAPPRRPPGPGRCSPPRRAGAAGPARGRR